MLENLMNLRRRFAIARHREAPLLKDREKFLEHLYSQGTSLAALRSVSWPLLNVITLLKLTRLRPRNPSTGVASIVSPPGGVYSLMERDTRVLQDFRAGHPPISPYRFAKFSSAMG